jgi:hypothetical protein
MRFGIIKSADFISNQQNSFCLLRNDSISWTLWNKRYKREFYIKVRATQYCTKNKVLIIFIWRRRLGQDVW